MSSIEDLREEFDAAYKEEFGTEWDGPVPISVQARLDEATQALHAAEDPWNACLCYFCLNRHR